MKMAIAGALFGIGSALLFPGLSAQFFGSMFIWASISLLVIFIKEKE